MTLQNLNIIRDALKMAAQDEKDMAEAIVINDELPPKDGQTARDVNSLRKIKTAHWQRHHEFIECLRAIDGKNWVEGCV